MTCDSDRMVTCTYSDGTIKRITLQEAYNRRRTDFKQTTTNSTTTKTETEIEIAACTRYLIILKWLKRAGFSTFMIGGAAEYYNDGKNSDASYRNTIVSTVGATVVLAPAITEKVIERYMNFTSKK